MAPIALMASTTIMANIAIWAITAISANKAISTFITMRVFRVNTVTKAAGEIAAIKAVSN